MSQLLSLFLNNRVSFVFSARTESSRSFVNLLIVGFIYLVGSAANTGDKSSQTIQLKDGRIAYQSAEFTKPIMNGRVLDARLRSVDGKTKSLRDLLGSQPTVLLFYRGGWCPYCNSQLADIQKAKAKIAAKGYQILALSPDLPAKINETVAGKKLEYEIYSDSKMNAAIAFGLAFQLPESLVKTYKDNYNIDVEAASGEKHHLLPVPAAYVVNKSGEIQYAYSNPDYKVRVDVEELLSKL